MIKPLRYQEALFWDIYPECIYMTPFNKLYNKKKLAESSIKAWYVVLFTDPESLFVNLPEHERQKELEENYLKGKSIHNDPDIQYCIENYPMSDAARNFLEWKNKLDQRMAFIKSVDWSEDTYDMLDKMLKGTKAIFDLYQQAVTEYQKDDVGRVKGGAQLSVSDMDMI